MFRGLVLVCLFLVMASPRMTCVGQKEREVSKAKITARVSGSRRPLKGEEMLQITTATI